MIINGKEYTRENLGKLFDYAMLSPDTTREQIKGHLEKAIRYNVNGVHCNPYWLPLIADTLEGTGIETGICPSFPFGADSTEMKIRQIETYCKVLNGRPGCVDTVTNVGLLRGGEFDAYTEDLREIVKVGHAYGYTVKAILETTLLTDGQVADASKCAAEAGVDFVKCASGRSGIADLRHIEIMKANVPSTVKLKFSAMGTASITALTIMGLAMGVSIFGTGYAHQIIEEIETYYKDLVISPSC